MSVIPLLSSRAFVTQLFTSLATPHPPPATNSNLLSNVSGTTKEQLLSLQVLFPNDLLPALDLLDRGLVTRFTITNDTTNPNVQLPFEAHNTVDVNAAASNAVQHSHVQNDRSTSLQSIQATTNADSTALHNHTIYYVRSAQQRNSRFTTSYDTTTWYEVRLQAWNCSCPAFAFTTFPSAHPDPTTAASDPDEHVEETWARDREWTFGGLSIGEGIPPVCKHLLACVLVARCGGMFGGFLEERRLSVEEAAGWAAGWGD